MPPLPPELRLLIDNMAAQIQQLQLRNDQVYSYVSNEADKAKAEIKSMLAVFEKGTDERLGGMDEDIKKIQDDLKAIKEVDLKELKDAIISKQEESYKRIIGAQAAILLIIVSTVIGLIVQVLHH